MPVLKMQLAGPLQSWGDASRFNHRGTRREPSKSGVIGLLAAAQGRQRTDSVADLVQLEFGVRADQVGRIQTDFQTEIDWRTHKSKPLTYRDYLADAKFLACVSGEAEMIAALADALANPKFPLFLGRRACPPSERILLGIADATLDDVLDSEPWLASGWYKKKQPKQLKLAISQDAKTGELADEVVSDVPVSFAERNRSFVMPKVIHRFSPLITNEAGTEISRHEPFDILGG